MHLRYTVMAAFTPKIRPFALVFGVLAAMVVVIVYFIFTRPKDAAQAVLIRSARERGLDVKAMLAAREALIEIDKTKNLSQEKWSQLKKLSQHSQRQVRGEAFSAMMGLRKSDKREEAIELCRTALKDPNEVVRSTAIIGLWKLDAPDWRTVLEHHKNTDTEWVRNSCGKVLKVVEARERKAKAKQNES